MAMRTWCSRCLYCLVSHNGYMYEYLVFTLSQLAVSVLALRVAVSVLTLRVGLHGPVGEEVTHGVVSNIVGHRAKPQEISAGRGGTEG